MSYTTLVKVATTQVRQDTCSLSLTSYAGASDGWWFWVIYPAGASAIAKALASACAHGLGSYGSTPGSWVNGNSITVGCTSLSASLMDYPTESGYWSQWGANHIMHINGSASGLTGSFRFIIPEPPAGIVKSVTSYVAVTQSGATVYTSPGGTAPGSYDHEMIFNSGSLGELTLSDEGYRHAGPFPEGCPCTNYPVSLGSSSASGNAVTYTAVMYLVYTMAGPDDCETQDAADLTDTGAILTGDNCCGEDSPYYFEWGVEGSDVVNQTPEQTGSGAITFELTDLEHDTWYWYRQVTCNGVGRKVWFKTLPDPNWSGAIITLPATEVWATGATVHGLYKGISGTRYVYLGFQYGIKSDVSGEPIIWLYSGNKGPGLQPIQMTLNGLYPDRTYYYRACLHVGTPPMNVNNYYGSTLSFGGPVSLLGLGREYITAKKASDDVSKLAVGRYYMDRDGIFTYESAKHRLAS